MINDTIYESTSESKAYKKLSIPFKKLEPGQSVFISYKECREDSLRSRISNENSKNEKKFKLIKHNEKEYFEIACIFIVNSNAIKEEYKIVEPSEKAKELSNYKIEGKCKYPFNDIPEGMSCILPIKGTNEISLKVQCYNQNRKNNRTFRLIKHEEHGIYEIYRVPIQKINFFNPSPKALESDTK